MKAYASPDLYRHYQEQGGELSYATWKRVLCRANELIMEEIIYGGRVFDMGHYLSRLSVVRVARNFDNPRINWPASHELRKTLLQEGLVPRDDAHPDGEEWLVYYTDDEYVRFHWEKYYARVAGKSAYSFHATRGTKGNKRRLKEHLRADPLAHLKYRKFD